MNTSLHIVNDLISKLGEYYEDQGRDPANLRDFLIWLNGRVFDSEGSEDSGHKGVGIDMELTFLLVMLSKHYKIYCKEALSGTAINTPDEYSFLYHLSMVKSFRKMELIHIHLLEAPSGIEVIKRLLKKGLIEEFDDKEDRRAKRIRITLLGKEETDRLMPRMKDVYQRMSAPMSQQEKLHFTSFLRTLNDEHIRSKKGH